MALEGARVSVGTTPTLLSGSPGDSTSGSRITVRNPSATVAVDLGDSTVATGAGYELAAGAVATFTLDPEDPLYGVVVAATQSVHVLRTGV